MGLKTRKEIEEIRQGKTVGEESPKLPTPPAPHTFRVRMHHPDTTINAPLRDFVMELDGKQVEVKGGVAEVDPDLAKTLESMDWRRGKELPLD